MTQSPTTQLWWLDVPTHLTWAERERLCESLQSNHLFADIHVWRFISVGWTRSTYLWSFPFFSYLPVFIWEALNCSGGLPCHFCVAAICLQLALRGNYMVRHFCQLHFAQVSAAPRMITTFSIRQHDTTSELVTMQSTSFSQQRCQYNSLWAPPTPPWA